METALSSLKSRDVRARALRELAANGHGMQHDDDALTAKVVQQHTTSSSLMDVDAIQRTFLTPPNGWVDGTCAGAAVDALRAVGGARGEDAARRALETLGSASRASGGSEEEVRMRALDALSRVATLTVEERRRWVVDPGLECVRAGAERGGGRLWANACSACCRAASGDRGEAYDDARVGIVVGMLGASTSGESDNDGGGGDSTTTTSAAERTKMLLRLAAARVCGRLGRRAQSAKDALIESCSKDKAVSVRCASATALGNMGPLKAQELRCLARMLGDKSDAVRVATTRAVGSLGGSAKSLIEKLAMNATRDDPELRQATCEAFEAIWKGKQGEPAPDGSDDIRLFQTAEIAGALTTDSDGGVRAAATNCLGHLRGAAAAKVSLINKRIEDTDEGVRDAAAETLTKLGFFNPNTGALKLKGNYRTTKFQANKTLFAALTTVGAPGATVAGTGDARPVVVKVPVGSIVRVWWPLDECWYEAKVTDASSARSRLFTLVYAEDGVEELVDFKKEKVELRHKPSKKGPTTWIPCGWKPRAVDAKKLKEKERAKKAKRDERERERRLKREERERSKRAKKASSGGPSGAGSKKNRLGEWIKLVVDAKDANPQSLVGRRVKVWWPLDKAWYAGEVRRFDAETSRHVVYYFEDNEEESLDLSQEQVQVYVPNDEISVPTIHGLEPKRLAVYAGETKGLFEPGCVRGSECVTVIGGKTLLASDFEKKFNRDVQQATRRWRRNVFVTGEKSNDGSPLPISKWLLRQGERWGIAIVGAECRMDVNVDMRDANEKDDDDDDTGDSPPKPVAPVWQRVKIVDYNATSGEHMVVDIDDVTGVPDPSRNTWLPLCMQRTHANAQSENA